MPCHTRKRRSEQWGWYDASASWLTAPLPSEVGAVPYGPQALWSGNPPAPDLQSKTRAAPEAVGEVGPGRAADPGSLCLAAQQLGAVPPLAGAQIRSMGIPS
ncbi:hypothetical protein KIL84_007607 [Mauremys mutica]|uniref:Uncharacterized protein n=1 Tax=Mauremys mutica TaxID=74926 RepID=A0A9D4AVS2_9SAUR|nr:hypothetical protein KIL84_007607 [Mauremys mutica]